MWVASGEDQFLAESFANQFSSQHILWLGRELDTEGKVFDAVERARNRIAFMETEDARYPSKQVASILTEELGKRKVSHYCRFTILDSGRVVGLFYFPIPNHGDVCGVAVRSLNEEYGVPIKREMSAIRDILVRRRK